MKKIGLVFFAVILTVSGFAQKTADLGIWGGTSTYWGDIESPSPLESFNLNMGAFFRYNFNPRVAMRTMFLTGSFSSDGLVETVPFSFKKNAQDITLMVEVNFLKYIIGEKKTPFTPYIMGGIGVMYYPFKQDSLALENFISINPYYPHLWTINESVVAASIPFGFGFKFSLGPRIGVGVEYQLRKLLNDKLDNLNDPLSYQYLGEERVKYTTPLHNNDWPGYLGVHVSYKLDLNQKDCPAYDRKYW
jgi:hypothetical protein